MRFGTTLRKTIYAPWKDKYVDYDRLKKLLKESDGGSSVEDDDDQWTADDESAFVDELLNVQLEKVSTFQAETHQKLRDRTTACEAKLDPLAIGLKKDAGSDGDSKAADKKPEVDADTRESILKEVLEELDKITKEVNELEKYCRINYTALYKATKKHDRKRGEGYRLRPFLDTRIAELPFNKEDYSPLLYRLSAMYSFVRQSLDGKGKESLSFAESQTGGEAFTSYKFWVHPENLLEVKTVILRRLPVLVYNPQTSKVAEGSQQDPTLTSVYFDNSDFSLYTAKVNQAPSAASLRLRWYGQLADKPEILFEKKTITEDDSSEEQRFPIKAKYIEPFIEGKYKMEKSIQKIQSREGDGSVDSFQKAVDDIQTFIKDNKLQPVLRANYTRTAFQVPGEDKVRISLDTNLALIREDAIDVERPCRDPEDWHRKDIDDASMEYPFNKIRKGEINRFPFALLEIKIKGHKKYEWVDDLMDSHLVKNAPRFSKFVHGIAMLFEDNVNSFPFWRSEVDTDIRRGPQEAFEQEQERKAKMAEEEFAVGSLFGTRPSGSYRPSISSPVGSPANAGAAGKSLKDRLSAPAHSPLPYATSPAAKEDVTEESEADDATLPSSGLTRPSGLRSLLPSFSSSKYARAHQTPNARLPPGVTNPTSWIKDQGPIRVEAKVWLANQRTFIKWQHVGVLLASLSLGLFNAAGEANTVARILAVVYTAIAVFALVWGWAIYMIRAKMIRERSPKDFDNQIGPVVVCVGLIVALCLNFGFQYRAMQQKQENTGAGHNSTIVGFEHIELF